MTSDVLIVRSAAYLDHEAPGMHPECPERIKPLLSLFETRPDFAALPVLPPKPAREADLIRVHAKEMVRAVLANKGSEGYYDPDTYFSEKSTDTALLAAGACIDAALAIW